MQHKQYWKNVQESVSRKLQSIEESAQALTKISDALPESQEQVLKILTLTKEIHEDLHTQYKPEMK